MIAAVSTAAVCFVTAPGHAQCTHCVIQSKAPSASAPGKFEYRVSCIVDISGDEENTVVTAASEEEAIAMVRARC
jgi:hypothetical protein